VAETGEKSKRREEGGGESLVQRGGYKRQKKREKEQYPIRVQPSLRRRKGAGGARRGAFDCEYPSNLGKKKRESKRAGGGEGSGTSQRRNKVKQGEGKKIQLL